MFSIDEGPPAPARIGCWWHGPGQLSGIPGERRLHDLRYWSATIAISQGHDVRTRRWPPRPLQARYHLRIYAYVTAAADEALADTVSLRSGSASDKPALAV